MDKRMNDRSQYWEKSSLNNHSDRLSLKKAISICIRTISKIHTLDVIFSHEEPSLRKNCAYLPELPQNATDREIAVIRGLGDSMALREAWHDRTIHAQFAPTDPETYAIFDALEQTRVEIIGSRAMDGIAHNLDMMLANKYSKIYRHMINNPSVPSIREAIVLLLREKTIMRPHTQEMESILAFWRKFIEEKSEPELCELTRHIDNQYAFAQTVRKMLVALDITIPLKKKPAHGDRKEWKSRPSSKNQMKKSLPKSEENNHTSRLDDTSQAKVTQEKILQEKWKKPQHPLYALQKMSKLAGYKIFTNQFDEILEATDFCPVSELDHLRHRLDQQLNAANLRNVVKRSANRLQNYLLAQQNYAWDFDLERGYLDTAKLPQLIITPTQSSLFKMNRRTHFRDTVVSLLIDNSGSMRGQPITIAAGCADVLAQILERCGIKIEILGFTTRAWNGGQTRERWIRQKKPHNPGRLNDLCHIIYKDADTPWYRTRRNLGLMIQDNFLKENIDGEALIWAHHRLLLRREPRRILIVLSDGAPVDDSTLSVNPNDYLEKHLYSVIQEIQTYSPVELIAIGIGHDVTRYYQRAITLANAEELIDGMIQQLAMLFSRKKTNPSRSYRNKHQ